MSCIFPVRYIVAGLVFEFVWQGRFAGIWSRGRHNDPSIPSQILDELLESTDIPKPKRCESWKNVILHLPSIALLLMDVVGPAWCRLAVYNARPTSGITKTKVWPGSPMTMGTLVET